MRYSTYLFIGEELQECATLVTQNILKNDNDTLRQHFNALQWCATPEGIVINELVHLPVDDKMFYPDESYLYQVGTILRTMFVYQNQERQIGAFFEDWFQTHMPESGKLLLTIVVRASDSNSLVYAKRIINILDQTRFSYDVDMIFLAPDLYPILVRDEEQSKQLKETIHNENQVAQNEMTTWTEFRNEKHCLGQIAFLQNRRKSGGSFNFDLPTLSRIISEYAQNCIENYHDVFKSETLVQVRKERKLTALGLSCLDFDRYYFLNYLLHQAYLHIMKREGVKQVIADVNKVSSLATNTLQARTKVMTSFYDKYIQSEIDKGNSGDTIVNNGILPQMNEFMSELEKAITEHINDEDLTLPEKSALMAQILLKDEEMLSGYLFNKNQPAFLDLFREPVNFFLDRYNASLEFEKDEEGHIIKDEETGIPVIKDPILNEPQNNNGYIEAPFDQLKKLRMSIQQCSEFIRQRTEELQELEKSREAIGKINNVVVDDEEYFKRFKLIGDDIKEDPLKEDYEPKPTTETNIDLSHDFTPIKSQGQLGACATFAVTSVYEYILKKNDRSDHDLSERFLYYNAREKDGRLDEEGVPISTAIRSIGEKGICTEEKWPYSFDEYNIKPSEEAYQDAESRLIKKALNLKLSDDMDKNRDTLRSAIAEGYPIVFSLNLFEAFDHIGSDGMVPVPSPGDPILQRNVTDDNNSSRHAMVACGYDDKNQVFLVRNSWGEHFGKQGYCFIPYAYICNHEYLNCAYIITEVTDTSIKVRGVKGKHKVVLDMNDIGVKIALTKNAIASKKQEQQKLVEDYNLLYNQFIRLIENLRNPSIREEIIEQTQSHYHNQSASLGKNRRLLDQEKITQLDLHDKETVLRKVIGWSIWALILTILGGITYYYGYIEYLTISLSTVLAIGGLALIRYSIYRNNSRKTLESDLDRVIAANHKELSQVETMSKELDHRQHVAGMLLDNLVVLDNNLQSLHNSLYNYLKNLTVWFDEENEKKQQMTPDEKPPFISLMDNDVLDSFFEKNKDELTENIRLYKIWNGNYVIDELEILLFKNKLKQHIKEELSKILEGFKTYHYISGAIQYPFLTDHQKKDLRPSLINKMDDYSKIFLQLVNITEPATHFIYVNHDKSLTREWRDLCSTHIEGGQPICEYISSPYKVLELQLEFITLNNIIILSKQE